MIEPRPPVSVRQRIGRWLAKAAMSASGVRFLPEWVRDPLKDFGFTRLIVDGYLNSAAFACLRVVVESFAEPEMHVHQSDDSGDKVILGDHDVRALLANPNPFMSEDVFWTYCMTYAGSTNSGTFYVLKERSNGSWPIALWPFHDGQITPVLHSTDWIAGYLLDVGDGTKYPVAAQDIIKWSWAIDPRSPQSGIGPLVPVYRDVSMDGEIRRYGHALAHNDAVPRTLVRVEGSGSLDDEAMGKLRKEWQKSFGGQNRGGVAIVGQAIKEVLRIGSNLQELQVESIHNIPESRIAACYGGAAVGYLAGLNVHLQRSTFSNAEEAELALHRRILAAKWRSVAAAITAGILRDKDENGNYIGYGTDDTSLTLEFDTTRVAAMQGLRQEQEKHVMSLYHGGLLRRNEARAALGRKPLEEDLLIELSTWVPGLPTDAASLPPVDLPTAKGRRPRASTAVRALTTQKRTVAATLERQLKDVLAEMQDDAIATVEAAGLNGKG